MAGTIDYLPVSIDSQIYEKEPYDYGGLLDFKMGVESILQQRKLRIATISDFRTPIHPFLLPKLPLCEFEDAAGGGVIGNQVIDVFSAQSAEDAFGFHHTSRNTNDGGNFDQIM